MLLYHYCCKHSASAITRYGLLRPHGKELFGVSLVWLTDLAVPDREGLGLTSHTLKCDRLECQYMVEVREPDVERWLDSDVRLRLSREEGYAAFEEGRQPESWWISRMPVKARRNMLYGGPGR